MRSGVVRTRRGGFTLVELLVVVLVVAILARVAIPSYRRYVYAARAATVVAEIHTVRIAAYAYHAETGAWPPDVNRGIVPPELAPYLGGGFTFVRDRYLLDWENWTLPDGTPERPETGTVVGISLTTEDTTLGRAFIDLLGDGTAAATIDDHYTFILVAAP